MLPAPLRSRYLTPYPPTIPISALTRLIPRDTLNELILPSLSLPFPCNDNPAQGPPRWFIALELWYHAFCPELWPILKRDSDDCNAVLYCLEAYSFELEDFGEDEDEIIARVEGDTRTLEDEQLRRWMAVYGSSFSSFLSPSTNPLRNDARPPSAALHGMRERFLEHHNPDIRRNLLDPSHSSEERSRLIEERDRLDKLALDTHALGRDWTAEFDAVEVPDTPTGSSSPPLPFFPFLSFLPSLPAPSSPSSKFTLALPLQSGQPPNPHPTPPLAPEPPTRPRLFSRLNPQRLHPPALLLYATAAHAVDNGGEAPRASDGGWGGVEALCARGGGVKASHLLCLACPPRSIDVVSSPPRSFVPSFSLPSDIQEPRPAWVLGEQQQLRVRCSSFLSLTCRSLSPCHLLFQLPIAMQSRCYSAPEQTRGQKGCENTSERFVGG